jgi:hypothetical protein
MYRRRRIVALVSVALISVVVVALVAVVLTVALVAIAIALVAVALILVVAGLLVAVEVLEVLVVVLVVIVAGSWWWWWWWTRLWLPFWVCLGDAACHVIYMGTYRPNLCNQMWAGSSAVKRGFYCYRKKSGV